MAQKGYSPETRKLLDVMSRRTIAFYPDLAITLDSIPAAIMLGQLLYWHGKQADPDGWIRKSAAEMEQETAISIRQQESARPILINVKAVEYERRGVPPIGHYKINHDNIIELFLRPVQLPQNVVIESPPNVVINSTPRSGDQLPPNVVIDTEITTESTSEITAPVADAPAPPSKPPQKAARRPSGFGTLITEHTDERVSAYLSILKPEISAGNADLILKRIHLDGIETWRDVLTTWAERGYNRTGFADMFERYDTLRNQKRVKSNGNRPQESERLKAQRAALEAELAGAE